MYGKGYLRVNLLLLLWVGEFLRLYSMSGKVGCENTRHVYARWVFNVALLLQYCSAISSRGSEARGFMFQAKCSPLQVLCFGMHSLHE